MTFSRQTDVLMKAVGPVANEPQSAPTPCVIASWIQGAASGASACAIRPACSPAPATAFVSAATRTFAGPSNGASTLTGSDENDVTVESWSTIGDHRYPYVAERASISSCPVIHGVVAVDADDDGDGDAPGVAEADGIDAEADGTVTIAGSGGRREPMARAPATSATSRATMAARSTSERRVERRDRIGSGVTTAVTRATGSWAAARNSIVSHRSGAGSRSRLAKRRRRSSIAVTQEVSEAAPAAAQVGSHGQAVRAQPVGDLADREIGVVEEDHRGALPIWQLPDGR